MKKFLLIGTIVVLAIALSSCALNVFKPFDKPSNLSSIAKNALSAANTGDVQTSISLSSEVITSAGSTSASTKVDLYSALTEPATSSKAKAVIEQVASDVKNVKSRIQNGIISKNSTTASAVKNAAIAMVRSISQVKKLSITNVISTILGVFSKPASSVSIKDTSPSFTASMASKIVVVLLSASRGMPTMDLLSELSSLLSVYGGKDEFNWDAANLIYDTLYVSTAFFDSNHDGVLTTSDEIFNYVWDKKNNCFKKPGTISFEKLETLTLGTYGKPALAQKVIDKMNEAIQSAKDGLNYLPPSFPIDSSYAQNILNKAETILSKFNANELASLKTLGDLMKALEIAFQ